MNDEALLKIIGELKRDYAELEAELGRVRKQLETLQEQHRGYDDLKAAVTANVRNGTLRSCAQLTVEAAKELQRRRMAEKERDEALKEIDRCREIADKDGKEYSELHKNHETLKAQKQELQALVDLYVADQMEGLHCVDCTADPGVACDCPLVSRICNAMADYVRPEPGAEEK